MAEDVVTKYNQQNKPIVRKSSLAKLKEKKSCVEINS
jgi:hypothetical protein